MNDQKHIYLADDEKNIRELMMAFLSEEGFKVKTFSNGDDLMQACSQQMPDLVILDIMMPGTDGGIRMPRKLEAAASAEQ